MSVNNVNSILKFNSAYKKQNIVGVFFSFIFVVNMRISEKYRIIEELGGQTRRKFGKVFLIEAKESGEKFILKSLKKEAQNGQIQLRLKNESTFTFDSVHLPQVIDFIETDSEIMLILRYKNGVTLDKYWKNVKRKNRLIILQKITSALVPIFEELRQKSIAHCDIKPSNILVQEHEQDIKLSLIDFGLSLNLNSPTSNRILFPLGYAAPELILNRLNCINHTSDIFSLGIVFWRLHEDKLPLSHPNPSVFTNLQITYPLPEGDKMSKSLNQIVKKMCFKHQFAQAPNLMSHNEVDQLLQIACDKRYSTLVQVSEDLDKILHQKSWINRILS